MSGELANIVVIDNETYSLAAIPSSGSSLVKAARADVLNNLNLDKLISDLELCKQLIYLASNGVKGAGTKESRQIVPLITEFHKNFTSVCGQADVQLSAIASGSAEVQEQLVLVFDLLLQGEFEVALDLLSGFTAIAEKLATSSTSLATQFSGLEQDASKILTDTQLALGVGEQAHEQLQEQIKEFKIKTDTANRLVTSVRELKKKLEDDYQEAKEKAENAETKAFALSIVGAIFQPLAAGLGAGLAIYTGGAAGALKNKAAAALPEDATKAAAENDAKVKAEEKDGAQQKADIADKAEIAADATKKESDTKVKAAKDLSDAEFDRLQTLIDKVMDEKDEKVVAQKKKLSEAKAELKAAEKNASDAQTALDEKKQASKDAKALLKMKTEAVNKAIEAAGVAGDKFSKMGDNYADVAASYRKEVSDLRKLLAEQVRAEHEALSNVQEYAARMKNAGPDLKGIELACDSLFQAVGALKQIVMILQEASYFWLKMAAACQKLQGAMVVKSVNAYKNLKPETRLAMLSRPAFKESVVRYYAGWKALELIATQYAAKATEVRAAAAKDFVTNLSEAEARAEARMLGEKLLTSVSAGLIANEATLQALASVSTEAPVGIDPPQKKAS